MSVMDDSHEDDIAIEGQVLIFNAADAIAEAMSNRGITRTEFAKLVDLGPGHIDMLMQGEHELSLKELAFLLYALGYRADISIKPLPDRGTL